MGVHSPGDWLGPLTSSGVLMGTGIWMTWNAGLWGAGLPLDSYRCPNSRVCRLGEGKDQGTFPHMPVPGSIQAVSIGYVRQAWPPLESVTAQQELKWSLQGQSGLQVRFVIEPLVGGVRRSEQCRRALGTDCLVVLCGLIPRGVFWTCVGALSVILGGDWLR